MYHHNSEDSSNQYHSHRQDCEKQHNESGGECQSFSECPDAGANVSYQKGSRGVNLGGAMPSGDGERVSDRPEGSDRTNRTGPDWRNAGCETGTAGVVFSDCETGDIERELRRLNADREIFGEAGSDASNTDPLKRQNDESRNREKGGFDWLEFSVYGSIESGIREDLMVELSKKQEKARAGVEGLEVILSAEESCLVNTHGEWLGDGMLFQVKSTGRGSGLNFYRYIVECQGIDVCICDKAETGDRRPVASVSIPSTVLMQYGDEQAIKLAYRICKVLCIQISREVVSRVDLCVDLPGESMEEVKELIGKEAIVTKAKKIKEIRSAKGFRKLETVYFGANSSPTQLRIYDKMEEVKKDGHKSWILHNTRWKGQEDMESAIRVEFQIRRDSLREQHSITSIQDLWDKRNSLAKYLVEDWFKFTTEAVDEHRHYERVGVSRLWCKVCRYFEEWTSQGGAKRKRKPLRRRALNRDTLMKQAVGCLETFVAASTYRVKDTAEVARRKLLDSLKAMNQMDAEKVKMDMIRKICEILERMDCGDGERLTASMRMKRYTLETSGMIGQ